MFMEMTFLISSICMKFKVFIAYKGAPLQKHTKTKPNEAVRIFSLSYTVLYNVYGTTYNTTTHTAGMLGDYMTWLYCSNQ